MASGASAFVLNQPVDLFKAGFGEVANDHVGAVVAEFALVVIPGDADDEGEASPRSGLNAGHRILDDDRPRGGYAQVGGGGGKNVGLRLALEPKFCGYNAVDDRA